ncbi:MAG: zf-HC2 domain-containing protein, partial [Chloroflexi bacterium]|nr:zf-HC2 domain-containing protein [Chloroflexota bacterium]
MSCEEVRDLLGAYVLDVVSDEERLAIEAHLAGCDLHAEVTGLRAAALGLGVAAP